MFSVSRVMGPLRAPHDDQGVGSGAGAPSEDELRARVDDCQLNLENIRRYILPALNSSDPELSQEAAFRLHGQLSRGSQNVHTGITQSLAKEILPELSSYAKSNPLSGSVTLLTYVIARVKDDDACKALADIFEAQMQNVAADPSGMMPTFTLGALKTFGASAAAATSVLENYRERVDLEVNEEIKLTLRHIYAAMRTESTKDCLGYSDPEHIDLRYALESIPAPRLPVVSQGKVGKLVDERVQFSINGISSGCRLRIFRCSEENVLAFFTADGLSYGTSITNSIEALATFATRKFGLNPNETRFVEHYDVTYGMHEDPEMSLISRLATGDNGRMESPAWMGFDSFEEGLEALETVGFRADWLKDAADLSTES
jgi:hypothetical protein